MAYCGILDNLDSIGGKPVDLSRLEEGILLVGKKKYRAEDWISEEDKLNFFNATGLLTKEELLADLEALLGRIGEEAEEDTVRSAAFYERYQALVGSFRDEIAAKTFPDALEDWWRYGYEIRETGAVLFLSHTDSFEINLDDTVEESRDTVFELLGVKTKLLTVEQYARIYGVTTTAVRQWIRRGKIRSAIKAGSEWRIPELAEVMYRGYKWGQFRRKEFLTDIPGEYAYFNEYDYVQLSQNEERKDFFDVWFVKDHDPLAYETEEEAIAENYRLVQMDQKEREKFELYLISCPFTEAEEGLLASR